MADLTVDYIKKDDALKCCPPIVDKHGHTFATSVEYDKIRKLEPEDVRPVVLCKDCDLWNEWDSSGRKSLGNYRCSCAEWTTEITTYYTGPDEFCSRGVRRESDG